MELVIVGAGGFGREVLAYAQDVFAAGVSGRVIGFADDDPTAIDGFDLPVRILGSLDRIEATPRLRFVIAVGNVQARRRLAATVAAQGGRLATLVHPTAYVAASATLGAGTVVCPFASVGGSAMVGANTLLNTHTSVAHDARVGEGCVLAPHAVVEGAATVGESVYLGARATVTSTRRVGAGCVLSAGAVVLRDVPDGSLATGNPASSRLLYPAAREAPREAAREESVPDRATR